MPNSHKARVKPTKRERPRYIKYETITGNHKEMTDNLKKLLGELGYAEAGIQIIEKQGKEGILRTESKSLERVKATMTLIPQNILTKKVSGTLKALRG